MRWRNYRNILAGPIYTCTLSVLDLHFPSEGHLGMSRLIQYRKQIRLPHYDYQADGFYFVTICTNKRQPRFSSNDVKARIRQKVNQIPQFFPGVVVDQIVVMNNHLHIIFTFESSGKSLGQVVQILKSWITRELKGPKPLWQPNYYEHVIRNQRALKKIREYIENNPLAEQIKCEQFYE